MINRTLIRLKVVQILYAYLLRENGNADAAEKELTFSLTKASDLYHYLLLLMVEIMYFAEDRITMRRNKLRPTEAELHPNMRFVENRFIRQLAANKQLAAYKETLKRTWADENETVRRLYDAIEHSPIYAEYMAKPEVTYEDDVELWKRLYKAFIVDNEQLDELFEEQSLYWNDDKSTIDTFVLKTIRRFEEANGADQPLLNDFRDEEDRVFASQLMRRAVENAADYQQIIDEHSANWDKERIAFMDRVIMVVALAEITSFPSIPVNVSLNEYLEITKYYSTPKSASFVNGVLDNAVKALKEKGVIDKA